MITTTHVQLLLTLVFASAVATAQVPGGKVDSKKIDPLFAAWDKPDSPGCALGVIRDGALIYTRGYGQATLEHDAPITSGTVFNIGSISKQFTAASIVLLAQDGKLSLDDDVRKYLPEIPVFERPITLRHLLNHTSGLRDYRELMGLAGKEPDNYYKEGELLRYITLQKRLNFSPGEHYYYSNTGYLLLGLIVKRVSGQPLEKFAEDRIFNPLGMTYTHFHGDRTRVVPHRATAYYPGNARFQINNPGLETGGTGVMTSIEDLLLWDRNFYANRLGGETGLTSALQTVGTLNNGKFINYALGLEIAKYRGLNTVSHGGRDGGFNSYFVRFPDQRFSVITLCNHSEANATELAFQVADLHLATQMQGVGNATTTDILPSRPVTESEAKPLLGWYKFADAPTLRRLYYKEGKLLYFRSPRNESELEWVSDNHFRMSPASTNTEVDFVPMAEGQHAALRVITNGKLATVLGAFTPKTYSADELATLEGDYIGDEFDICVSIRVRGGQLRAGTLNADPQLRDVKLWPTIADQFRIESGIPLTLSILRDAEQHITGFRLDGDRVRNLIFVRQEKTSIAR